ncbi:MAG: DUF106 domain-containing protein [Candidatus Aenigmarchaeota archaeon]|nr:DUF106 domain-containing protein [Candidatus Aenigmarchaeota archaeon]
MLLPYQQVFWISVGVSFVMVLFYKFLADQDKIGNLKKDMDFLKQKANKAQKDGDLKKSQEYMNEMMKMSSKQMTLNMRPMMASLIFVAIMLYLVLYPLYPGVKLDLPFYLPLFEMDMSWFWWYVVASVPTNLMFRKLMGVH